MRIFLSLSSKAMAVYAVRFVLVGILNTSFSYLIYATLLFVGLGYQLANFLALIMGILFSFKTQGRFVFNNPDNRLLGRYVVSWVLIYFCVVILIGEIIDLGFDAYSAGALALPFSVVLSYFAQKYFVFRQSDKGKAGADRG